MKKYFIFCIIGVVLSVLNINAQQEIPVDMILINGGTFIMGSPVNELNRMNDEIQHPVKVSSFYMGKYLVTQEEYNEIMGTHRSSFNGSYLPVEMVTWFDAIEYCNKRSQKEGLTPAYIINGRIPATGNPIIAATVTWNKTANGYRLPTEAEWEYACRAGTTTRFYTGDSITSNQANYNERGPYLNNSYSEGVFRATTTEAGSFAANPWGLYDMHGNVAEWCWDWYGDYNQSLQTNPTGAASGNARVTRGGSWYMPDVALRSAARSRNYADHLDYAIGFRVVRN
jgi:formylglycine-generating enzyme required for sulfatase activity